MELNDCGLISYCSESDDIDHSIDTISKDLMVVGLPAIAKFQSSSPGITVSSLINTVWTLLQQRQRLVDEKRQLNNNLLILSNNLKKSEKQLKEINETLLNEQELQLKERKKHLLTGQSRSEALQRSKSLILELKEHKQLYKSQERQAKHEYNRQKEEVAILTARLRALLLREKGAVWKDRNCDLNKIQIDDSSKEERVIQLYKKSISRLENNVQALVKENLELRKLLDNVREDVAELMYKTHL